MLEDVGTQHRADDDTTEAIDIVNCNGIRKEAIVCPHTSHHHVSNKEVSLRHRHIMLLRRLALDEIEYCWRALHTEEAAHQSAQCSSDYLYFLRCRKFYALTEKHKVDANQDECYAKDATQYMVFDTCQDKDGNGRDDDERQQNRPKPLPNDVATQPPYDSYRSGDGQQS